MMAREIWCAVPSVPGLMASTGMSLATAQATSLLSVAAFGATTAGKNVVSTLKEALSIFSDGALRAVTSESSVSIRDLIERKTAAYIEMLDEGDPYGVVYTCFLNQWWQVAHVMHGHLRGSPDD